MTSSRWHRASHRAFRTEERRDSWSGEPSGTSISSPQKARLECGFQQGGGAVSFVTRERHSLLPRHPFLEFLPPRLPCLALLAWLSSCWYLHPIVAPTTFVSSSSFSLFLSLSFFLCFSLRLRPPSSAAPPGAPFNCQLPHGDLENFLLVFKNGQSTRKREANPTHHAASLSALICYF